MLLLDNIINDLGWSRKYLMKPWVFVQNCKCCNGITLLHVALSHYVLCFLVLLSLAFATVFQGSSPRPLTNLNNLCLGILIQAYNFHYYLHVGYFKTMYLTPTWTELQGRSPSYHFWNVFTVMPHRYLTFCVPGTVLFPFWPNPFFVFFRACNLASKPTPLLTFTITRSSTECSALLLKKSFYFPLTSSFNNFSWFFVIYSDFLAFFVNFSWFQRLGVNDGRCWMVMFLLKGFIVMLALGGRSDFPEEAWF